MKKEKRRKRRKNGGVVSFFSLNRDGVGAVADIFVFSSLFVLLLRLLLLFEDFERRGRTNEDDDK